MLPLENLSGDPAQDYFADGMTDELITELAQIKALRVISRSSVIAYKNAHKPLPEIARELNDTRGVGIALNALAANARDDGEVSTARSLFEESLAIWRGLNDRAMVARALSNVASVVKSQRNYALARSLH